MQIPDQGITEAIIGELANMRFTTYQIQNLILQGVMVKLHKSQASTGAPLFDGGLMAV